jgi:hypothetical protein
VRALVEGHLPGSLPELDIGEAADNMHAYADDRELLERVAAWVRRADGDPAFLVAAIEAAGADLE